MGPEDVLTEEEIETLLDGTDELVPADAGQRRREVEPYDIFNPKGKQPIVLPRLKKLIERMTDGVERLAPNTLNAEAEVTLASLKMQPYGDLLATVEPPLVYAVVPMPPLSGSLMVVVGAEVIDASVDTLFGGTGRPAKLSERAYSASERRIGVKLAEAFCLALANSGDPLTDIQHGDVRIEIDADYALPCDPRESVLVAQIELKLESGRGGVIYMVMPDGMFDPVRERLDVDKKIAVGDDPAWRNAIRDTVGAAAIELRGRIDGVQLLLSDILRLSAGDFIPIDSADELTLYAGTSPVMRGALGTHAGKHAVRVTTPPNTETTIH